MRRLAGVGARMGDVEDVLGRLDRLRHVAENGYWLTTAELCQLIDAHPAELKPLSAFGWRNFKARRTSSLGSQQVMWQVTAGEAEGERPEPDAEPRLTFTERNFPVVTSRHAVVPNFFHPEVAGDILAYAMRRQADFQPAIIEQGQNVGQSSARSNVTLSDFPEIATLFYQAIVPHVRPCLDAFNLPWVPEIALDLQMTAYNDGSYYKMHFDALGHSLRSRYISIVYYFFREPKAFSGGELQLYGGTWVDDAYTLTPGPAVAPMHNACVFFPSILPHEVLPVRCPSGAFADSRFAITGWIHAHP